MNTQNTNEITFHNNNAVYYSDLKIIATLKK